MRIDLRPTRADFVVGIKKFESGEPRDPMYSVASRLLDRDWGKPRSMAEDLGVLLFTWNQAFYRYGWFEFGRLEGALARHMKEMKALRSRSLRTFGPEDGRRVKSLFRDFSWALRIYEGRSKDRETPVGTAKALHLLAPNFFPLWDQYIAAAYSCRYVTDAPSAYIRFCGLTQGFLRHVRHFRPALPKTHRRGLLKQIDEYNYAVCTLPALKRRFG